MTERDSQIIELIKITNVATREQIQKLLFKDIHENVALRRLKKLTDDKHIKRSYFNIDDRKNVYVYYMDKKPAKRNLRHNLLITDFIVNVMTMSEILEANTNYRIGEIISDAYIKYKGVDGKTRHLFLEVQLSNKVEDTTSKYKNIKEVILEHRRDWNTIPRLIVVTDLKHDNEQIRNVKTCYDSTNMENLRDILF